MLFDKSEEMGDSPGLGVLAGKVVRFNFDDGRQPMDDRLPSADQKSIDVHPSRITHHALQTNCPSSIVHRLKVPHIRWNTLDFRPDAALFQGLGQGWRVSCGDY